MSLSYKKIPIKTLGKSTNKSSRIYEERLTRIQNYIDNLRENVKRMMERRNKTESN